MLLVEFMLYLYKMLKNQREREHVLKEKKITEHSLNYCTRKFFHFHNYFFFLLKLKITKCTRGFCQISFDLSGMQHKSCFITNNSSSKCQKIYAIYKTDVLHFFFKIKKKKLYIIKGQFGFATVFYQLIAQLGLCVK